MIYDVIFEKFPFLRVEAESMAEAAREARKRAEVIIIEESRDQIALDLRIIQIKKVRV